MFIIFTLPSFVPITTMSFWKAEATIEQIRTLFYIFRYKNNVYTFPLLLDTCHTLRDLSRPQVMTLLAALLIIAPVTEV
jgi:hypothetical protein